MKSWTRSAKTTFGYVNEPQRNAAVSQVSLKTYSRLIRHRASRLTGFRLLKRKRWGVDWLEDCSRICRERWNPNFTTLDTVFDVGANVGQSAIHFCQRLESKHVLSFEPVSATFNDLVKNTSHLPAVQCLPYGLSDANEESQINIFSSSVFATTCDSTPVMNTQNQSFERSETIQLRTLDSAREDLGVDQIDLLKVDTEGADLRTIRGAEESLRRRKIGFIVFEFYQVSSHESPVGTLVPLDEFLASHGYRFISFYTDFVHANQPTGIYNALYMAP